MFGRKSNSVAPPPSPEIGLLGSGTRFVGTIRFRGTLRLDGEVEGDIRSDSGSGAVLVVNRNARVTGTVVSDSVMISGAVEGDVVAEQRVEIFSRGSLRGDIYTNEITIEAGAEFQGRCHMIRDLDRKQLRALSDKHGVAPTAPPLSPEGAEPLGGQAPA